MSYVCLDMSRKYNHKKIKEGFFANVKQPFVVQFNLKHIRKQEAIVCKGILIRLISSKAEILAVTIKIPSKNKIKRS